MDERLQRGYATGERERRPRHARGRRLPALERAEFVAANRFAKCHRLRHGIGHQLVPQLTAERFEIGQRSRTIAGREPERHQPSNRILAQRIEPQQRLCEGDRAPVIECAAPLFRERDQIRRVKFAQPLAFGEHPVIVEILEIFAAVQLDRRISEAVSAEMFVGFGIDFEWGVRVPAQRHLIADDPRPIRCRIGKRGQRAVQMPAQRGARARIVLIGPELLGDGGP